MARHYDRAGAAPVQMHERERPMTLRAPAHESRDAEAERADVRIESDAARNLIDPLNLQAPEPRPGYVQRWIYDGGANGDMRDTSWVKKRLMGWEPRDPATISDRERRIYQTSKSQSGETMIRMGPMVLCELPRNVAMERKIAVKEKTLKARQSAHPGTEALRNGEARKAGLVGDVRITDESRVVKGRRAATMLE